MPFIPDQPFEKSLGDLIRAQDWNDAIHEIQRLDTAKVNKTGDAITGPLTISGSVGIGTTAPNRSLTIANNTGANYLNVKDGTHEILMGIDSSGGIVSVMTNHDLVLRAGTNSEKMRIKANGNVGIGTATPASGVKLEVAGTTKTSKLRLADKWLLSGDGDAQVNDEWLRLLKADGTNAYYGGLAAGKLWSSSGSLAGSDLRMKRDIGALHHSLRDILALRGVRFKWQSEGEAGKDQLGLIAQEVESVFPELVETGPDGMKGIHYQGLMAPLIEAIKQQQLQIAELQTEIRMLKAA